VDNDHGSGLHFPQLALVVLGKSEGLNEGDPVLDGDAHEFTQVGVHDVLKAIDDALEGGGFIVGTVCFEEVVISTKLVLDLTNKEVTPLNQHVLGHRLMVGVLNLVDVTKLSRQLKDGLVGIEVPKLEEVDAFLCENLGHANEICIRAPVLLDDFIKVLREVVLGASYDTEVWSSLLREADGNLELEELLVVGSVLHLLQNDALLHLTNIFLFDYTHKVLKGVVDLVRVKLIALANAFAEEVVATLLREY